MPDTQTYTGYDGEKLAKQIYTYLTEDVTFEIPSIDLSGDGYNIPDEMIDAWLKATPSITLEELTSRQPRGSGVFDALMEATANHLREEFQANRITGAEYTKAYSALTQACMTNAVTFLLGKDKAQWDAITAQIGAITSNVQLQLAKIALLKAQIDALTAKAQYASTVMNLAIQDAQYATSKEQYESTRAQTMETRSDGSTVEGSIGKQKDLYDQQIDSYKKDAQLKAAKVWSETWTAQKSLDEGLTAPNILSNDTVNTVLTTIKNSNNL